jgi:hypothetical protein
MSIKNKTTFLTKAFFIGLTFFILSTPVVFANNVIETGDSQATTVVENNVNTVIKTCCSPTPTQGPALTPTPTPITEVTPTSGPKATPTPKPSNGGNGGSSSGGGVGGSSSSVAGTSTGPTQGVLGLSTTSGGANMLVQWLQLFGAFGLISTGALFYKKNA